MSLLCSYIIGETLPIPFYQIHDHPDPTSYHPLDPSLSHFIHFPYFNFIDRRLLGMEPPPVPTNSPLTFYSPIFSLASRSRDDHPLLSSTWENPPSPPHHLSSSKAESILNAPLTVLAARDSLCSPSLPQPYLLHLV